MSLEQEQQQLTTEPQRLLDCGRCKGATTEDECAHYGCWWCQAVLCKGCWEAHGHCGHAEAESINEQARRVPQPLRRSR